MNKKFMFIFISFLAVFFYLNTSMTTHADTSVSYTVVNGIIDLSNESQIVEQQNVSLHGEWEFYWDELLEPEDMKENRMGHYIHVPSSWQGQIMNGEKRSNFGYGTYRVQIKLPPEDIGENKGLYIKYIGSAYQIWIDGEEKDRIGEVGRNVVEEIPKLRINLVFFEPKQETVEIVVQVSNYSFREGGIFGEVLYGDTRTLIPFILKDVFKDIFIICGFFFIGIYYLIIFAIRKNQLSMLWIGLVGLAAALRTLLMREYIVFLLFPNSSWEWMVKIEYLTEVAGFIFLVLLMKHLYPQEVHQTMIRLSYGLTIVLSIYILLSAVQVFSQTLMIHSVLMGSFLIYFVVYVGVLAAIRNREGAYINVIALMILFVSVCHDTLYFTQVIDTAPILEFSVLLFFFLQALIISYRYSLLFNKNKTLTKELSEINNTLEEKVRERTSELHKKNKILFHQASIDGLTGVFNRRHFLNKFKEMVLETRESMSLIIFDIDDFKKINDGYGHIVGDQVLVKFSEIFKKSFHNEYMMGRLGGEEFAVFVKDLNQSKVFEDADRFRLLLEETKMSNYGEKQVTITVSIGIAYMKNKDIQFEELYQKADEALYLSKKNGKNQIHIWNTCLEKFLM